jgi:hypothetical protein
MVASVAALPLVITVNSINWSQNLVSLEIGWDSYEHGNGLILKKGTLTLCNILGDSKLIDPIDQDDFVPGSIVTVSITGVGAHPLAGKLRILAPPEVSAINQGIPEIEGNLVVAIPVGCELAYFKTQEPDSDATGVTLGTDKQLDLVISDLLGAAGIPSADLGFANLSPLTTYSIAFPYSKNGGGFVDLAGEFAYVGQASAISALYCNKNNYLRVATLPDITKIASDGTIVLGTDDREYARQLDSTLAPGEIEIDGIQRSVEDRTLEYPFTDIVEEEQALYTNTDNGDGTQTTTTTIVTVRTEKTYYYAEGIVPRSIRERIQNFTPSSGKEGIEFLRYKAYQGTETVTYQDNVETGREYQFSLFDWSDRLGCEVSYVAVQAVTLYPDGWETAGSTVTTQNRIDNTADNLVPSEIVVTEFAFNLDSVISRITTVYANLFLIDRSADFSDDDSSIAPDFYWAFTKYFIGGYNLGVKQIKTESWKQQSGRWVYDTQTKVPLIINNPGFVGNPDNRSKNRRIKLSLDPKASIPSSTSILARDTQPPSITYREGRYRLTETQLTGRAVFGTGANAKRYKIQSPFWMSATQPDRFAQIEGQIINGRQYQHIIEAQPSLFTSIEKPLALFRVIEPSKQRFFLCDSLTWFHSATEAYVAFAGILVGSATGDIEARFPTDYPTTLFPAVSGDGPLIDDDGDVVLDANGNVVSSGTITISGYAIGSTVRGVAYDI